MSVKITDICIACGACIDECPVEAIVDDDDSPNNDGAYFVYNDKCVECVGHNDAPACADACPTEGCIVWDAVVDGQAFRDDIGEDKRSSHTPVVE
ncbi:ferredoxin [Helicobacter valdiviensis]|uniref:Ferredoxin n=1 Tax=Helicobacter valdiviensis TaxID=1458358 RepID=A0A2W6MWR8_9HELI|nr:4Fe-4S binding protein [Helicobacter valdiviensis]PZT48409.1 ferredoxin [Helicobacter valdiviensis]